MCASKVLKYFEHCQRRLRDVRILCQDRGSMKQILRSLAGCSNSLQSITETDLSERLRKSSHGCEQLEARAAQRVFGDRDGQVGVARSPLRVDDFDVRRPAR